MAAQTGRTVGRWFKFQVKDSAGTLRDVPVSSINGVGLEYPEADLAAFQDAIKGVLPELPECTIEIEGPFDTSAAQAASGSAAAPALSGSHTVLNPINGLSVPLSLAVYVGIRHNWETGEPVFGLTSTATNGFLCTSYIVDINAGKYKAKFRPAAGSAAPAWGTAAIT